MLLVKGFDKWRSRRNAYKRCYQDRVADLLRRMCCFISVLFPWASQVVLEVKNPPASTRDIRDTGSIPGSGGSPGRGPGKRLQYSCLENPLDRGAWWATVRGVTKSRPRLKWLSTHALFPSRLWAHQRQQPFTVVSLQPQGLCWARSKFSTNVCWLTDD